MYKFQKMRRLWKQGNNFSQIAKELNINRKTVAKYLKCNTPPSYSKREKSTRNDPFAPFKNLAEQLLGKSDEVLAVDVYETLVKKGYQGSERTVRRRIAEFKANEDKERFFEQEYTPGEQSQFDFKKKTFFYNHGGSLPITPLNILK